MQNFSFLFLLFVNSYYSSIIIISKQSTNSHAIVIGELLVPESFAIVH